MPAIPLPSSSPRAGARRGYASRWLSATATSAILTSCAPVDQFFDPGPPPETTVKAAPVRTPPVDRRPAIAVRPQQEPQHMAATERHRSKPPIKPAQLTGLDPRAMSLLLGRPNSIQKRDVKYVWAYDGPSCELRVVFYPDIQTKQFHVLQTAVVDSGGKPLVDTAPCMRGIRSRTQ
jgi:hypothetical protein